MRPAEISPVISLGKLRVIIVGITMGVLIQNWLAESKL